MTRSLNVPIIDDPSLFVKAFRKESPHREIRGPEVAGKSFLMSGLDSRRFRRGSQLLVNRGGGGKTPALSAAELEALGFRMVIFPGDARKAAGKAVLKVLGTFKERGIVTVWSNEDLLTHPGKSSPRRKRQYTGVFRQPFGEFLGGIFQSRRMRPVQMTLFEDER